MHGVHHRVLWRGLGAALATLVFPRLDPENFIATEIIQSTHRAGGKFLSIEVDISAA
jgi:hypothetical protein